MRKFIDYLYIEIPLIKNILYDLRFKYEHYCNGSALGCGGR